MLTSAISVLYLVFPDCSLLRVLEATVASVPLDGPFPWRREAGWAVFGKPSRFDHMTFRAEGEWAAESGTGHFRLPRYALRREHREQVTFV